MRNLVRLAVALFLAFETLEVAPADQEQQCRVSVQLENSQFESSAWVHPRLMSLGPTSIYVVHISDGGMDLSVERVSEQSRVLRAAPAGLVSVDRKKLARHTYKHTFAEDDLLAVDWREVATDQSSDGSRFTVPAGVYRFSLFFSESYPAWTGKVMRICRVYSEAFVLANDSKWGTDY